MSARTMEFPRRLATLVSTLRRKGVNSVTPRQPGSRADGWKVKQYLRTLNSAFNGQFRGCSLPDWEDGLLDGLKPGLIVNPENPEDYVDFFGESVKERYSHGFFQTGSPRPMHATSRSEAGTQRVVPDSWEDDTADEDGLVEIPRIDRIQESIARVDEYIKSTRDNRSIDDKYNWAINERLSKLDSPESWTNAVNLMRTARDLKEFFLMTNPLPKAKLDRLDKVEEHALSALYGTFKFLGGFSDTDDPELFDKNKFDELMEEKFGSLNHPQNSILSEEEARQIFSMYLSRKVWCLTPWRKFASATEGFYKRTVYSELKTPVDIDAAACATRICEILMQMGEDEIEDFRDVEPAPEASCNERSKMEGGKRFALLVGGRRIWKHVKPVSIYTGGKIRTITKDSAKFVKYAWINKWLGAQFRKLKCSIFGGDVAEWFQKIGGKFRPGQGKFYISGDLESATDLFDGRISRLLLHMIARKTGMSGSEMASFTTDALFKVSKNKFVRQTRGQLMGSVLSFPLLCIMSLTAYICKDRAKLSKLLNMDKGGSWLRNLKSVGINGDDIVFIGGQQEIEFWTEGVKAIGGVVSRGKTLVNRDYFTVNSELWNSNGKINCLRPSLLTALTGDNRYFISPQYEWKEFRDCKIVSPEGERIWNLVDKLNLNVPRCFGGIGLVKKFDPEKMLAEFERREIESNFSHVYLFSERFKQESDERRRQLNKQGPCYESWVSKDMADAFKSMYKTKAFNFRLKPHEIRFCLSELAHPDQFDASYLAPFRGQFEKVAFPRLDEIKRRIRKDQNVILAKLERTYDYMMDGLKCVRIPVNLIRSFNGLVEDDVAAQINADDEFRLDHGSLCRTDMETRDYTVYRGPDFERSYFENWTPAYKNAGDRRNMKPTRRGY